MPWWGWIFVGATLLAAEVALSTDFYLVFFGAGALVLGVLGLVGLSLPVWAQWLLFALLWESVLGNVLNGIRWLAIGPWGREVAGEISPRVPVPDTGLVYALVASALITLATVWFAGDRLRSFTLRGDE